MSELHNLNFTRQPGEEKLGSTALMMLAFQHFRNPKLAIADSTLAQESQAVTNSDLKSNIATLERALAAALQSNATLAKPYAAQNNALQGDISQNVKIQENFERLFINFMIEENNEFEKLSKEVKKGTITVKEAEQKFMDVFTTKSDDLIKKFKGYAINEKKSQDSLEQLLKQVISAFPAARSDEAAKLLAKKQKPEASEPERLRPE